RILHPLSGMLGWAAVLALILYPLQERLTRLVGGRRALSAALLTAITPFLVLAPLSVLTGAFVGQVTRLIEYLRGHSALSLAEVLERLSGYPIIGGAVGWVRENSWVSAAQFESWMTGGLQTLLRSAAAMGGDVALGSIGTVVGFFMVLFMLFCFLRGAVDRRERAAPASHRATGRGVDAGDLRGRDRRRRGLRHPRARDRPGAALLRGGAGALRTGELKPHRGALSSPAFPVECARHGSV